MADVGLAAHRMFGGQTSGRPAATPPDNAQLSAGRRGGNSWVTVQPSRGHPAAIAWPPFDCRVAIELPAWMRARHRNQENTMKTSTDYTKLAASLDYAALDKKLTQLTERQPPKKRKNAADVLEPLRERLLALQQKGWSSGQLAEELRAAGIPVSPARLRECLNRWTSGDNGAGKRRARRRQVLAPTAVTSPTSTPMSAMPKKPVIGPAQSPFTLR